MKKQIRWAILVLIIGIGVAFLISQIPEKKVEEKKIVGNTTILSELDHLLLPVAYKNITESDLNPLKEMVQGDEYAEDEVHELQLMARYQEYSHVGHGIGFLYEYIQTGNESVCPGHALAHYAVFLKHGESEVATENLEEAQEGFEKWENLDLQQQSQIENYSEYNNLFSSILKKFDSGNSTLTEDEIFTLSDAPCLK